MAWVRYSRGVMVKALDDGFVVSEFELQSRYYVGYRIVLQSKQRDFSAYIYFFFCLHVALNGYLVLYSLEELCITRITTGYSFAWVLNAPGAGAYIKITKYMKIVKYMKLPFYENCLSVLIYELYYDNNIHCLMSRAFVNGPGDLGSIPGWVIQKTPKMVLHAALLNTQHYKVRIKGKVEQSREWSSALPYTSV